MPVNPPKQHVHFSNHHVCPYTAYNKHTMTARFDLIHAAWTTKGGSCEFYAANLLHQAIVLTQKTTADVSSVWFYATKLNRCTSFDYTHSMLSLTSLDHFHWPFHTMHDSCDMHARSKQAFLYNLYSNQRALSMLCATTHVADWFWLQTTALPGPRPRYNCTPRRHPQVIVCSKPAWCPSVISTNGKTHL